jgi:hypothetical protein
LVATRLEALSDDRVAASLPQPERLLNGVRGGEDFRASCLDALKEVRLGQAEVEAHDLGREFLDQITERLIEWVANGSRVWCVQVHAEFIVIGFEPLPPSSLASRVGARRLVAEEVHVDGP